MGHNGHLAGGSSIHQSPGIVFQVALVFGFDRDVPCDFQSLTIAHVFEKTYSKTIRNEAAVGEAGSPVSVDQDEMQRSPSLSVVDVPGGGSSGGFISLGTMNK